MSIYAIGAGFRGLEGLTLEALQALDRCTVVFSFEDLPWLPHLCAEIGTAYQRLEYPPRVDRLELYERTADHILAAAELGSTVCFVTHGSASRFVWITHLLSRRAQTDLVIKILPNVNAVDELIARLGLDDSSGVGTYEASHMLSRKQVPDTSTHLFILDLENTGNAASIAGIWVDPLVLTPLRDHLLHFYPASHRVAFALVDTTTTGHRSTWTRLADMAGDVKHDNVFGTLYLPPLVPLQGPADIGIP